MEEIIELIKKACIKYNDDQASIRVFKDGSNRIYAWSDFVEEFDSLDELRTHLNE